MWLLELVSTDGNGFDFYVQYSSDQCKSSSYFIV